MTRPISDNEAAKATLKMLTGLATLSKEAWTNFSRATAMSSPARRRPLVRYLLFCCGKKCLTWVCNDTLSKELGYCQRSLRNHLNELEKLGIIQRIPIDLRVGRAIVFPRHQYANEIYVEGSTPAIFAGRPRQFLPVDPGNFCRQIPLTVPVQAETIKKRNSRTRGEPPETIAALEDGEKKDLSNGNGETLTPLATENAPRGKDVPGAGGKSSGPRACPGCGKAMETAGKTRMNPEGTHLACFRCGIQNARGEIADPVVAVAPGDPAPSPGESPGHEYLRRLRKGSSSADCDLAYQVLCKAFGSTDARDSSKAYRSYVNRVRRGFLSVDVLTYAFTQATHPSAINPGKIFAYNIAHRIRPKSDG